MDVNRFTRRSFVRIKEEPESPLAEDLWLSEILAHLLRNVTNLGTVQSHQLRRPAGPCYNFSPWT